MKRILTSILLLIIAFPTWGESLLPKNRCSGSLALVFGASFSFCAPVDFYRGAAITVGDGLIVKFEDGGSFFSQIVASEHDGLDESFDMSLYPAYAFGMRDVSGLGASAEKFKNTIKLYQSRKGSLPPRVFSESDRIIYIWSADNETDVFVVKSGVKNFVLLLGFSNVSSQKIEEILKGVR